MMTRVFAEGHTLTFFVGLPCWLVTLIKDADIEIRV